MSQQVTANSLAIEGGTPVRSTPFTAWPIWDHTEERLLLEVLHSGKWGELDGGKVRQFARAFADLQGATYGVCVPNGTIALELGYQALGVGHGDEVITSAYTFIATASSALTSGARPIFVDIDPRSNMIDPAAIEAAITPKTKAIVPVHIGGQPPDMDGVLDVAKRHGLPVMEDAAQGWGAAWKGTPVGALGDLGTFSFQSSKNVTAGEGGILLTNDDRLYALAESIHNVGRVPNGAWYQHENLGRNLRMTEWQAAILLAQLTRFPEQMALRDRNAAILTEGFAEIPGFDPVSVDPRVTRHAWHLYQIHYDPAQVGGKSREEVLAALKAEGIPASAGYVSLTDQPAVQNTLRARFGADALNNLAEVPHTQHAARHTIWLQQTLLLGNDQDAQDILSAFRKVATAFS